MTQIMAAARPAKTARHMAKIREMRKVKGAIRWTERARAQRQKAALDRSEERSSHDQQRKWRQDNIVKPVREAKKNLKEDYELGPLRPNRAMSRGADKYGAMGPDNMRRPPMKASVWMRKNENRMAKGYEPEYPLVVDDKKYFPFAVGDRVMVMKGKEQGKIGVIDELDDGAHDITIKGFNKQYVDGAVWSVPQGETRPAKRETEIPIALEDVRLVIPYRMTTQDQNGNDVDTWSDVVVDKISMERHTTGRDPFTNIDYGTQEFPEEHRFDPETGLAIFNRYIAGTTRRIKWPWENVMPESVKTARVPKVKEDTSLIGKLGSPVKFLKDKLGKGKESQVAKEPKTPEQIEAYKLRSKLHQVEATPTIARGPSAAFSQDNVDDTGRNKAEPSPHTSSFYPTLVYPPFPSQVAPELEEHTKEVKEREHDENFDWYKDAKEVTPEERAERKAAKAEKVQKKSMPDSMKTPMQLRYEIDRRNKLAEAEKNKVDRKALLIALGQHMQEVKVAKKVARSLEKQEAATAQLD